MTFPRNLWTGRLITSRVYLNQHIFSLQKYELDARAERE